MQAIRFIRRVLYWTTEVITLLGLVETILREFSNFVVQVKNTINPDVETGND